MIWTLGLLAALTVGGCNRHDERVTPVVTEPALSRSAPAHAPEVPTHDLSLDESMGGHTLARHVARTDGDLRDRLRREQTISSASTYTDRSTAERVVAAALATADGRLESWRRRSGRRPNLALDYVGTQSIGRSLMRGQRTPVTCYRAVVVLRWDERRERDYVLTSYPEADR